MGIIAWIIIGLLAGAIAKALMPGKDPGGIIVTMLIGIVGGLLGGWLGKVIFGVDSIDGFFDLSTWIAAIVGSLILLFIYRLVVGRRSSHRHA
ncbi:GlsB/YeaQ/YmgE family stress response membrane protein [Streptomyces ziwulingensis]|uniref:GlsB/YeaQ/YmgE family stress response membrane protein n=1 Tax=Streptomyces ziwulingensis TaxID=1045501 RepID=A0ABP9D2F1_9ACTN